LSVSLSCLALSLSFPCPVLVLSCLFFTFSESCLCLGPWFLIFSLVLFQLILRCVVVVFVLVSLLLQLDCGAPPLRYAANGLILMLLLFCLALHCVFVTCRVCLFFVTYILSRLILSYLVSCCHVFCFPVLFCLVSVKGGHMLVVELLLGQSDLNINQAADDGVCLVLPCLCALPWLCLYLCL
jgi:hypothetical protein